MDKEREVSGADGSGRQPEKTGDVNVQSEDVNLADQPDDQVNAESSVQEEEQIPPVAPEENVAEGESITVQVDEVQSEKTLEGAAEEVPPTSVAGNNDQDTPAKGNEEEIIASKPETEQTESVHEDHDEAHDEPHDEEEIVDYNEYSKADFVKLIKELVLWDDVIKADRKVRVISPFFDTLKKKDREEALKKFIEEGGEEADFSYKNDELTDRFEANFQLLHDKKVSFLKGREHSQEQNYEKKRLVLEKLREFVDSEETNISFNKFKEIQEEWKHIGPVPPAHNRTLWANYNALVDRFYDNRSIYFELKELDRRKNLEKKLELCDRAEVLKDVKDLKEAIKELNELHHEFKHLGPVPADEQENLWKRFKSASDEIYSRRKEYVSHLKKELEENLAKKEVLCEEIKVYVEFDSDKIRDWNDRTKEVLDLQKKWEAIGGLPRAKAKDINRHFWSAFKQFFNNKGQFFKKLDAQRDGNLVKKQEMVKKALELQDNEDWEATSAELKKLQKEWREVGPVPEKQREKIYAEFKAACDHFFTHRRASLSDAERDYVDNLKAKEVICDELEKAAGKPDGTPERLKELEEKFHAIGFVPKGAVKKIKDRYKKAVTRYLDKMQGLSADEKETMLIEDEINRLKNEPNASQKIYRKEQILRKQIKQLEDDISLWKNNLEFFASSKKADSLKEEFNVKIDKASEELNTLKHELKMLRMV